MAVVVDDSQELEERLEVAEMVRLVVTSRQHLQTVVVKQAVGSSSSMKSVKNKFSCHRMNE